MAWTSLPRVRSQLPAVFLVAAFAVAPAPASAARHVPEGWLGVMVDGPMLDPATNIDGEFGQMVSDGVESVRTAFYWANAQPYPSFDQVPAGQRGRFRDVGGVPTDFSEFDRVAAAAAQRHLRLLPVIIRAPAWAAADPGNAASPPRQTGPYARFAAALVHRYGPGSLGGEPNTPGWRESQSGAPITTGRSVKRRSVEARTTRSMAEKSVGTPPTSRKRARWPDGTWSKLA